ncbi:predicted protein [Pyrenophora tritici-repentis Pt-1C-BFP]|uniref:Uncharacterized protein n=1 Tax=Pyrenophora tritici-repentis (strain Pt-1C-BFP) TaxID=426418 RepID=B2W8V9_PYRTR|nr:uncharacterized protein PTRG_06417 [Pyrenophora tritici-repentis Pt-1C-BFP]EDU49337.1 predicted protein [Pyrenophora tritici-repentis Pt-1C-BFP]
MSPVGGSMALAEQDPNGGGRTSRASNASALSRASGKPLNGASGSDHPVFPNGISSMLRTTMDMGDVGLLNDPLGIANSNRHLQRHRAASRMSAASSMSGHSSRASKQYRAQPSSSSAPRHSAGLNTPQYVTDMLSPMAMSMAGSSPSNRTDNRNQESHRSRSMTDQVQPPYNLASNRSLASLRPQALQPPSPYHPNLHGGVFRSYTPNYRSASPALSDNAGLHPRDLYSYDDQRPPHGGRGQATPSWAPPSAYYSNGQQYGMQAQQYLGPGGNPHNVGQMRMRLSSHPSALSLEDRREEEDSMPPFSDHQMGKLHSSISLPPRQTRRQLQSDTPPLPTNHRNRIAVEKARLQTSVQGSVSSGSTMIRTDSEAPSSDMALPPTPRDGASMEALRNPNGTHLIRPSDLGPNRFANTTERTPVPYYDGSEQFHTNEMAEPESDTIPTGFAEAALNSDPFLGQQARPMPMVVVSPKMTDIPTVPISTEEIKTANPESVADIVPEIAELPASPVVRRITRNLILQGLKVSSMEDIQSSTTKSLNTLRTSKSDELPIKMQYAISECVGTPSHQDKEQNYRNSILSQTGSSILDSSTINFAVRHSIPVATGGGFANEIAPGTDKELSIPASPGHSTEDGMSDVLAGYQRPDSKAETEGLPRDETTKEKAKLLTDNMETPTDEDLKPSPLVTGSRNSQTQRSSDEQSFKSCTDKPDESSVLVSPETEQDPDGKSFRSATDVLLDRQPSQKGSNVHHLAVGKVDVSSESAASMPPSLLSSSNLGTMVMKQSRPKFEMSLPKPPAAMLRKQLPVPSRESSFSIVTSKLRTASKPSVKQGSVSMSGSSSTLGLPQVPPVVPPRESSTSKEAQRVHAAVSFLMRPLPSRFAIGRKRPDQDDMLKSGEMDQPAYESAQDTDGTPATNRILQPSTPVEAVKTAQTTPTMPTGVPPAKMRAITFDTPDVCKSYKARGSSPAPVIYENSCSNASPVVPEPSSVYSIQDLPSRSQEGSSTDDGPATSETNRRDSQTTTHLEWHRYVPPPTGGCSQHMQLRPPGGIGSHLNSLALSPLTNIQEDTTTDLRLSGYRYPGPSRYLPDLKEESHEDSSLNTSASNLKSSSFRFPFGNPSGIRASGEDQANFSRRSSMASQRRSAMGSNVGSALGQAHGLPSMRFSRMNLFDGFTDELGLRYSRSMEEVPNVSQMVQRLSRGSPTRPASAGDVTGMRVSLAELDAAERSRLSMQPTTIMNLFAMHRAHSPELMAEIERLTIPSVGGLTQRFSEFFPSLKEYYKSGEPAEFPVEEEIEKHALEEIHDIHPTQKRSSARLRPMRGNSHMVIIDDDLYEELTNKENEKGKGKQGGPGDGVENGASVAASNMDKSDDLTNTTTARQTVPLTELQAPSPAVIRPRSHTVGPEEFRISETRPWNIDKNYPWATSTNPAIDISLPPPTATRHSSRRGPSHLRNRLSETLTESSFSTTQTATASPFGTPADSTAHARQHRFSTFGRGSDQPHAVGERYPTSALSPPTAIFRDHLSASDTSDDEENYDTTRKTRLSLRKRFSSTRKATLEQHSTSRATGRSKTNPSDLASPESTTSIVQDSAGEAQAFSSATAATNRHTFHEAEGMRAVDYRKQRIIDRLKTWWHKGSRLLRQFSYRKNTTHTSFKDMKPTPWEYYLLRLDEDDNVIAISIGPVPPAPPNTPVPTPSPPTPPPSPPMTNGHI